MIRKRPLLIVVTGPTGSGKTDIAIRLARRLDTEIVSADSRQVFRDIPIGTAAPTPEQLAAARHHLVGFLGLDEYYSAARWADDARTILDRLWQTHDSAIVCGGSMLYIDALVDGLDQLPTVSRTVRDKVLETYRSEGIEGITHMLEHLDPQYLHTAPDLSNHKRLIHAAEVSIEAGCPYSSIIGHRGNSARHFDVIKLAINLDRDTLFARINARTDAMIAAGWEEEARRVHHLRHLNSLNTVGYKELFAMFDGTMPREIAIPRIAKNTRVYAKKQLTWLKRDTTVAWLDPARDYLDQALDLIK